MQDKLEKMANTDDIGDPIIISECKDVKMVTYGLLIVTDKGIAYIYEKGALESLTYGPGTTSKWVRWHDVAGIYSKKPGTIILEVKKRKEGKILMNKQLGIPKKIELILKILRNSNETNNHYKQRKAEFFGIVMELYNQYKTDIDLATSDSRI